LAAAFSIAMNAVIVPSLWGNDAGMVASVAVMDIRASVTAAFAPARSSSSEEDDSGKLDGGRAAVSGCAIAGGWVNDASFLYACLAALAQPGVLTGTPMSSRSDLQALLVSTLSAFR